MVLQWHERIHIADDSQRLEDNTLEAVRVMLHRTVIPCHCDSPGSFTKTYNPVNNVYFRREVEKPAAECMLLGISDSVAV